MPVVVTEQYPEGLGPTVETLAELAAEDAFFSKVHFSSAQNKGIRGKIETIKPSQIVIGGVEAHVCVLQSALGFMEQGYQCCVVAWFTSVAAVPRLVDLCLSRRDLAGAAVQNIFHVITYFNFF